MSKICIVLANFGTTHIEGLKGILNIKNHINDKFKNIPVKITFTSNIIRRVWKKRRENFNEWIDKGVPYEILNVKGIVATIGDCIEEEIKNIIVQPTHLFYMEQVHDLYSYINAFKSIKTMKKKWLPFDNIVMGRPALGMFSEKYNYIDDIRRAVKALKKDIDLAKMNNSSLLYMAHGNKDFPNGIFYEIESIFNETFPEINTVFACIEGKPSLSEAIKKIKSKNILLKPFMVVAGTHAKEDMKGWKGILKNMNFNVNDILEGLGEIDEFAKIYVNHINDVINDLKFLE